jgi:predicted transcriptional regulator of viral defense system
MRLSTIEVTVLDLVSKPSHGGGLSNVATILGEMVREAALDPPVLTEAAASYPASVLQRTGWLLAFVAGVVRKTIDLESLRQVVATRATPTPLYSHGPRRGPVDECWNVVVNGRVEPDLAAERGGRVERLVTRALRVRPQPNATTLEAMGELEEGKGAPFDTAEELFEDLGI